MPLYGLPEELNGVNELPGSPRLIVAEGSSELDEPVGGTVLPSVASGVPESAEYVLVFVM